MSLICFGLFIWTLKAVPEFRVRGIFFLDTLIPWEYVVSWNWYSETILHIDYMLKQKAKGEEELRITELSTYIPEEDKKNVEDRKSTRLNSSHVTISYAVCRLKT